MNCLETSATSMSQTFHRQIFGQMHKEYANEQAAIIPDYGFTQFQYLFREGTESTRSLNNIFFDSKSPPTYASTFSGNFATYTGGVADGWTADVGVTATESSSGGIPTQRLTGLNGFSQAFRLTSAVTGLTNGYIYYFSVGVKKISGASGNVQIRWDGIVSGTTTLTVTNANLDTGNFSPHYFYAIMDGTTTNIEVTSDDPTLVIEINNCMMQEVGGGNHMVMPHDLYSRASRGSNYYDFDGTSMYALITEERQSNLDLQNKWSCACIVRLDGAQNGVVTAKWLPTGGQRGWQSFRFSTANRRLEAYWSSTGGNVNSQFSANTIYDAQPWSGFKCIGMSFDNGTVTFYVNGKLQANGASSGTGTTIFNNTSDAFMGMVPQADGSPGAFYEGPLGKQIIWSGSALTAAQHSQVFAILRHGYTII